MPFLTITSADRISGVDSNFSVPMSNGPKHVKGVRLMQANFMNLLYNVTDGSGLAPANNRFSFRYGADANSVANYSVTISPGNYNWTTISAALTAAVVTATGAAITFSLNSTTGKITITVPTGGYIQVLPLDSNAGLNLMLGFSRYNPTSLSLNSVTAPRCLNLVRYQNLTVIANFVPTLSYSTVLKNRCSILGSIPISVSFGEKVSYQVQNAFPILTDNNAITDIDISVIDDLGYGVDLNTYLSLTVDIQF